MVSTEGSESGIDVQIRVIRGISVMLDVDLARLYGVTTGGLLQACAATANAFPQTSCFPLPLRKLRF
jgi:hypothetical protein